MRSSWSMQIGAARLCSQLAPFPMHEEAQALSRLLGLAEISTRTATSLPIPKALSGLLAPHHQEPSIVRI